MDSQHDPAQPVALPKRLPIWTLIVLLLAAFTFMADHLASMQLHIDKLESARLQESMRLQRDMHCQLDELCAKLDTPCTAAERAAALSERVESTEVLLGDIGQTMEAQTSKLIEIRQDSLDQSELAERLAAFGATSDTRWNSLVAQVSTLEDSTQKAQDAVERLDTQPGKPVVRDLDRMWSELVGPIVQLSGDVTVGSGVLLKSRIDKHSGSYVTQVLTAWHVVRDIQGDLTRTKMPVPVTIYSPDGKTEHVEAKLLVFNAKLDAALLEIKTEAPFENGANLASRERLAELEIFDRIYAVGCPLGNDPIPTAGEIATVRHKVDGGNYLMVNAPTYIGNSGGGIFDSKTHDLIGIFSKIYTHGAVRPTIVPHMGLATPLNRIYDWLQGEGYASVIPTKVDAQLASR
jgi:hypothetical protein